MSLLGIFTTHAKHKTLKWSINYLLLVYFWSIYHSLLSTAKTKTSYSLICILSITLSHLQDRLNPGHVFPFNYKILQMLHILQLPKRLLMNVHPYNWKKLPSRNMLSFFLKGHPKQRSTSLIRKLAPNLSPAWIQTNEITRASTKQKLTTHKKSHKYLSMIPSICLRTSWARLRVRIWTKFS